MRLARTFGKCSVVSPRFRFRNSLDIKSEWKAITSKFPSNRVNPSQHNRNRHWHIHCTCILKEKVGCRKRIITESLLGLLLAHYRLPSVLLLLSPSRKRPLQRQEPPSHRTQLIRASVERARAARRPRRRQLAYQTPSIQASGVPTQMRAAPLQRRILVVLRPPQAPIVRRLIRVQRTRRLELMLA
jgi:hypothetical protein